MGTGTTLYAGFWRRFIAIIIDRFILGLVFWIFVAVFGSGRLAEIVSMGRQPDPTVILAFVRTVWLISIAFTVINWLYFALLESSSKQATLGKMALSMRVTDLQGQRIGFGRATGRYFGKIISAIILYVGYMMAGWTEKKQALHDMMAGTLVVRSL